MTVPISFLCLVAAAASKAVQGTRGPAFRDRGIADHDSPGFDLDYCGTLVVRGDMPQRFVTRDAVVRRTELHALLAAVLAAAALGFPKLPRWPRPLLTVVQHVP